MNYLPLFRSLQAPATDMIYRTLNNNKKVLDTYGKTISQLTSQLVKLRMHNTSTQWQTRHGVRDTTPEPPTQLTRDSPRIIENMTSPAAYAPRTLGQRTSARRQQLNRSVNQITQNIY